MINLIQTLNKLRIASGLEALQESTVKKMGRSKIEAAIVKLSSIEETPAEETPVEKVTHALEDLKDAVSKLLPVDEVPETLEARLEAGYSPWGGHPSNQTAAGEDGTFLGDSCNFCHEHLKAYNRFTGEEVDMPSSKNGKKRRVLNPQGKIDAKVDALTDVGIETNYNRPARLWVFTKGKKAAQLTSRQFSEYTPDELAAYVAQRLQA